MRLEIQNIGMIENADIKLDGLTVIAGENDTGKSTVGKVLFCLIKSISNHEDNFYQYKEQQIEEILAKLFFYIRKDGNVSTFQALKDLNIFVNIGRYKHRNSNIEYLNTISNYISKLNLDSNDDISSIVEHLNETINEENSVHKYIQTSLNKIFYSEFNSKILKHDCNSGNIKLFEGNLLLMDISVDFNKIVLADNFQPIYLDDATFIETPLVLNNHDLLIRSHTGLNVSSELGLSYTTLHTKDLFDKLKEVSFSKFFNDENSDNEVLENVSSLIDGRLIYDNDEKDFKYKKNEISMPIKNTATGIKSFGIIQMLVENEFINEKSFLILDEPEIHLHPKWQLEYAKLIALLVQNNIPVLVTSHSPYMIEALQRYTQDNKNVNFYIAENENISKVDDSNSLTLSKIFTKLSEPFEVFDEMDSQKLQNG